MAVRMVRAITHPDGKTIGEVPETHPALVAGDLQLAPSERGPERPVNLSPEEGGEEPQPARNASTDVWREYATSHGLSSEEAEDMSRDELVDYFTSEED